MKLRTIKVADEDWAKWKEEANADGVSLSAWIRGRCDAKSDKAVKAEGRGYRVSERRRDAGGAIARGAGDEGDSELPSGSGAGGGTSAEQGVSAETCPHGAGFNRCKKWGCYFYEIANGRGPRLS